MWRLIFDIIQFNQFALDLLIAEDVGNSITRIYDENEMESLKMSIGEYLEREGYSQTFRDDYLIPLTACFWSTTPDKCSLDFPAITLIRFLWNHHFLNTVTAKPPWLTILGGAKQYIDAVMTNFPNERLHLKSKVTRVVPDKNGTVVLETMGQMEVFDHVILATHGDQALEILGDAANRCEREVLGEFQTSRNVAILHSDLRLMPKRRLARSSWNFMTESPFPPSKETTNVSKICLTCNMNVLQHIPEKEYGPVLVTLNPLVPPDPRLVQGIWEYSHPRYSPVAIRSQRRLGEIQNTRGISYCGAWTKYGFHEDGFSSGISVAMNHLNAKLPFQFVDSTFPRGKKPVLTLKNHLVRTVICLIHLVIVGVSRLIENLWRRLDRKISKRRKAV